MTPMQLSEVLDRMFPPTATSWREATDEVRDMSRTARMLLQLDEQYAVDFNAIDTPSEWNRRWCESIVNFYIWMSDIDRAKFIEMWQETLNQPKVN